jgi:hypothetical protein
VVCTTLGYFEYHGNLKHQTLGRRKWWLKMTYISKHHIYICMYISIYLSIDLSIYLSIYLSISLYLSLSLYIYTQYIYIYINWDFRTRIGRRWFSWETIKFHVLSYSWPSRAKTYPFCLGQRWLCDSRWLQTSEYTLRLPKKSGQIVYFSSWDSTTIYIYIL